MAWKCSFGFWNCTVCKRAPAPSAPNNRAAYASAVAAEFRVYLTVPYAQKDMAKRLGARWDADRKAWYADNRKPLAPFRMWGAAAVAAAPVAKPKPARPVLVAEAVAESIVTAGIDRLINPGAELTTDDLFAALDATREAPKVSKPAAPQAEYVFDVASMAIGTSRR